MSDFGAGLKIMIIVFGVGCALSGAAVVGVIWLGVLLL
jgi:hypothetical protein